MKGFTPASVKRQGTSFAVALAISSSLFLLPLAVAFAVQVYAPGPSLLLAMLAGVLTSFALARAGAALWSRSTHTGERVFADATLWGWMRVRRSNRRIAEFERMMSDHDAVSDEDHKRALMRLADALELRDHRTHGHSRRVTRHAASIAKQMGLDADELARLRVAAAMHDIGKLHVPAEVLFKPAKLTDEEFALIKQHPVDSAEMVAFTDDDELIAGVRHHHERWDGRGYPDGLAGTQIPLHSRIIAVADTFDAIVSDRPYRDGVAHRRAQSVIADGAGSQFDPEVAEAFATYYRGGDVAVAWGALSALPPRAAQWIADVLRGGASVVGSAAGTAAASVAITVGVVGGGLPAAAAVAERAGLPVPAAVQAIAKGSLDGGGQSNGFEVESGDDEETNLVAEAVDPRTGEPITGTEPGAAAGGQNAADESGSRSESAPGGKETEPESSRQPESSGGETVSDTTDAAGETVKDVGETVKDVGETVKEVAGDNDVTEVVDKTTDTVSGTVTNTGETVKNVGKDVGDALGGLTGKKK